MDENILTCLITCITQLITTLITVGVTIFVAYRTYCSQKRRNDNESRRLQFVNCNSSLELFRAYIANLIIFSSPMKRFVKCFFELSTQTFLERRGTDRKKGRIPRLWTLKSRFRGWVV